MGSRTRVLTGDLGGDGSRQKYLAGVTDIRRLGGGGGGGAGGDDQWVTGEDEGDAAHR